MKRLTVRELKNSTAEVVRALRRGESMLLTFRGKPLGTIEPLRNETVDRPSIPSYDEAWAEIETELERSKPRFASWKEAENESRGRR
jgi:antitoxin (DNA-binding transcriptional repressor) of toxin-antitoxin stability system